MKKENIYILIAIGIIAVLGAYILVSLSTTDDTTVGPSLNTNRNVSTIYSSAQYPFSISLPEGWSVEEDPNYIDGVERYTRSNIHFSYPSKNITLRLIIEDNKAGYTSGQQYFSNVVNGEKDQRFKSESEVMFSDTPAYFVKDFSQPDGYFDQVYVVSTGHIYFFSYSQMTDEGIYSVTDDLRNQIYGLLKTFQIN